MTVYVDDMHELELGRYRRMKMSHMIADTTEELKAMADLIGVARRWIQHKGGHAEHFDIAKGKRELALAAGAVPITVKQCAAMCRRRAETGALGDPEDAIDWLQTYSRLARELKTA